MLYIFCHVRNPVSFHRQNEIQFSQSYRSFANNSQEPQLTKIAG